MITAVIWDMGGIMYRYFTELILELGRERDWPVDRLACGPTGKVPDPTYGDMIEGRIDEHDYLDIIRARMEEQGIPFDPVKELDWPSSKRPETWEAISLIHDAGIRQGLLTNDATRWLGEQWWETWEPAQWFEAMVDVKTIGVRKPAPEPYLAVAEALGTPPVECIFIDDMLSNCRGAEAVGMASHWFDITAPRVSIDRLLTLLGVEASEAPA